MTAPLRPEGPFYATPEEVAQAQERLKARGLGPSIVRNLRNFGINALSGAERAGAALLDVGHDLFTPSEQPGAPLPLGGRGRGPAGPRPAGVTAAGDDAARLLERKSTANLEASQRLKEEARAQGALHTYGLPFTDAEITDLGVSGTAGQVAGAAVPYVAATALAPEVEAPALLTRLTRFAPQLTRAATVSAAAAPVTAAFARDPETSTLGAIGALTKSPTIQRLAEKPVPRYLTEALLDLGANVGGEVASSAAHARKARKALRPEGVTTPPPKVPAPVSAPPAAEGGAAGIAELWTRRPQPKSPEATGALEAVEAAALADPSPAAGKLQVTTFPDGTKVATRYRLVDRAELAPSHDAFTFQRNPEAMPGIQGRSYDADPGAQGAITRGGLEYDPDRALNPASSPGEGPPVVSAKPNDAGKRDLVAGNARVLMFDRATAQMPDRIGRYRQALRDRAGEFGINPELVDQYREPILVRELVDPDGRLSTPEALATLNNLSDRSTTKVKSRGDDAATRAANLTAAPDALEHYARTYDPDRSLADYLRTGDGREFFGKLIEGGVIAPEEARGFANAAGELDDIGRGRLEDILRASVLGDPRIAERGGQYVRKLDSALPSLALVRLAGPEWDLTPTIAKAVEGLQRVKAAGLKSIDELAGQGDLLGEAIDPEALAMARLLERTPARELRDRVRRYATAAQEAGARAEGGATDLFPELAAGPEQMRQELFGLAGGEKGPTAIASSSPAESGLPLSQSSTAESGSLSQERDLGRQTATPVPAPPSVEKALSTSPSASRGGFASSEVGASIVGSVDEGSGRTILQPSQNLPELVRLGKETVPVVKRALEEVARDIPGVEVFGVRAKIAKAAESDGGYRRSLAKMAKGGSSPGTLSDLVGGRIIVDDYRQSDQVLQAIAEKLGGLTPGTTPDPKWEGGQGGYRALHGQVTVPNGMSVEIQVVPREIADVQEDLHLVYNAVRGDHGTPPAAVINALDDYATGEFNRAWAAHQARIGEASTVTPPDAGLLDRKAALAAALEAHPDTPPELTGALERYLAPQEELFSGPPRRWLDATAGVVKANKAGAATGAAIGATTADPDQGESRLLEGVKGGLLGALTQAGIRSALRALERPAAPEAKPVKPAGSTPGPTERLSALKAEIPPKPAALEPVSPEVTRVRPELDVKDQRPRDRSARGYFNIPRLNLPMELQDQLANRVTAMAPKGQGVPKRVVSNEETRQMAAKLLGAKTPDELAAIDWKRMSGTEGVALASLVGERTRQVDELVTKLKDPSLVGKERKRLEDAVVRLDAEANDLLKAVMRGASEQGRDLQANKILANLRSPEAALIRAQRHLGERLLTPEEKAHLVGLVNAGDQEAVAGYIAGLRKASLPEQLVVLRKAGLLTSVRNRVLDLTSNVISLFEQQGLSKPAQVAADFLLARQTGQRTRFFGNRDLYRQQVGTGLRRGFTEALDEMGIHELTKGGLPRNGAQLRQRVHNWVEKMREVKLTPQQLEKYGIPRVTTLDFLPGGEGSRGNRLLDAYMKAGFQSASVADRIVKTAAYRGAMVDAAESLARAEKTPASRMSARVAELVAAPTDEMIATASLEAERIVFMNSEAAAKLANGIKRLPATLFKNQAQKDAANAMMDFLFPFVKTGANIGARISDYAGLAGVRAVIGYSALRKAIAEGADAAAIRALQKEVTTLVGRATTGALAMYGVGLWAYNKGLVTGAYPSSGKERSQWELEGKEANSVLIGGEWVPLARATPLGAVIVAGANLGSALENEDLTPAEKALATTTATTRTALDQPLVTGTKQLLDALQDNEGFGKGLLRSSVASSVPTAVADVSKLTDAGRRRRPEGAIEAAKERIPGLRGTLPARIDALGRESKAREGALDIFLNPFSGTKDRSADPVVAMLRETGARITKPRQEKGETASQFEFRSRLEGETIYQALRDLLDSGQLEGLDPDEAVRAVDDEVRTVRRDIRDQLRDLGLLQRSEEP